MDKLAESLRVMVKESKKTVTAIAAEMGTSRTCVYDVVKGRYIPTPKVLEALLSALEVDDKKRSELHELRKSDRDETRADRNLRKTRYTDRLLGNELLERLVERGFPAKLGPMDGADVAIASNNDLFAVYVKTRISDHARILGTALIDMERAGYKKAFFVVPLPSEEDRRIGPFLKKHNVMILTAEGLIEELGKEPEDDSLPDIESLSRGII